MIAVSAVLMSVIYIFKYQSLQLRFADQGSFYYLIGQLLHNQSWFDFSTDFAHRFGAHLSLTLFFFVPFQLLFDSPLTMLFLQAFIISLGAYPAYMIGRHFFTEAAEGSYRLLLPLAYLCYIPLLKANLYDFDTVKLAPVIMLYFLYYAVLKKNDKAALPFMLLLILTRETLPLIASGAGVYFFFFEKERVRGLIYFVSGLLIFYLMNFQLMPYYRLHYPNFSIFEKEELAYLKLRYGYIAGNGFADTVKNIILHPLVFLNGFLLTPAFKWPNLIGLIALLLFIPLFRLKYFVVSVFSVLIYFASDIDVQFVYKHQYFSEMFPPLFLCFAHGLKYFKDTPFKLRLVEKLKQRFIIISVVFFAGCAVSQYGMWIAQSLGIRSKHAELIEVIKSDPLKIKEKNDAAVLLHNRLFPYFGWHKYLTQTLHFENAHSIYMQQPDVKDLYFIELLDSDFAGNQEQQKKIIDKIKAAGFKEVFNHKTMVIFHKGKLK